MKKEAWRFLERVNLSRGEGNELKICCNLEITLPSPPHALLKSVYKSTRRRYNFFNKKIIF